MSKQETLFQLQDEYGHLPIVQEFINKVQALNDKFVCTTYSEGFVIRTQQNGSWALIDQDRGAVQLFHPIASAFLRQYILNYFTSLGTKLYTDSATLLSRYYRASSVFLNPTNHCNANCPHCIYSIRPGDHTDYHCNQQLTDAETQAIIVFLTQSQARMIQFSGGGEPFQHPPVMYSIISSVSTLKNVIFVTNNIFSANPSILQKTLAQLKACNQERVQSGYSPVKYIFRVSWDEKLPMSARAIINLVSAVDQYKSTGDTQFEVVLRLILQNWKQTEGVERELEKLLAGKIEPEQLENEIYPFRQLVRDSPLDPIKVVYRPFYSVGRGDDLQFEKIKQVYTLDQLIEATLKNHNIFPLATRGDKSDGYGPLIGIVEGAQRNGQPITEFQLAPYMTATGKISLNGGVPDTAIHISDGLDWRAFLHLHIYDPLERLGLQGGVLAFVEKALEIHPTTWDAIHKTNFVLSIPLIALESSAKRLYITIRALQEMNTKHLIAFDKLESQISKLITTDKDVLQNIYQQQYTRALDPVILKTEDGPYDSVGGNIHSLNHILFIGKRTPRDYIEENLS